MWRGLGTGFGSTRRVFGRNEVEDRYVVEVECYLVDGMCAIKSEVVDV